MLHRGWIVGGISLYESNQRDMEKSLKKDSLQDDNFIVINGP